ncbi:MAG: thioredoxin domain-containing protein [Terriglobales bacterium]
MPNGLASASSAYLRAAAHQPVAWQTWGEAAFAHAQEQNRPILLDIGAVWCHWCHVMDRESYEDPRIAELINRDFVAIKVDRDQRPDVDARYQLAVAALCGQGGWPLTAFLTPEGEPFFGGTYFPPAEGGGRPSFARVLESVARAYREQPQQLRESAARLVAALGTMETPPSAGAAAPRLDAAPIAAILDAAVKTFDARHGGFGHAPKFSHPATVDLLLDRYTRDSAAGQSGMVFGNIAFLTLEKMARGGVYDHLAGGFHRYSVDERWAVPHFEKMAYDNSELLNNYVHAAQVTGSAFFRGVALDIMRWADEVLSDRRQPGFYTSQDADISLEDDGGYFTWTRAEAQAALTPEEFQLAAGYYGIYERGEMAHDPARNVLAVADGIEDFATRHHRPLEQAQATLAAARDKLHAARLRRPTPTVDTAIYANWNAMFIRAYLRAQALRGQMDNSAEGGRLAAARVFALRALDRMLAERDAEHGLRHHLFTPEGEAIYGLDDQAFPALAALEAFALTGEGRYYAAARDLADLVLRRYGDSAGGFNDLPGDGAGRPGALAAPRKPLQDSPAPSGNAAAIWLLDRLAALSGETRYAQTAEAALRYFASAGAGFGIFAGAYGLALRLHLAPPLQILILPGDGSGARVDSVAAELEDEARAAYQLERAVIAADPARLEGWPEELARTVRALPASPRARAVVCRHFTCLPPAYSREELRTLLAPASTS